MRTGYLLLAVLLLPSPAAAQWQVKPFVGLTFAGATTLVDVEKAAPRVHRTFGITGAVMGEVFGIGADIGRMSGFFQTSDQGLLLSSAVTTLSGDVIAAVPRRMTQYTLRPYFVAGVGLMRVRIDGKFGALRTASTLPAMNLGGGVTGFLTRRVGLSWEVRRFGSVGGKDRLNGASFGDEQLSFWRATMAVAIGY